MADAKKENEGGITKQAEGPMDNRDGQQEAVPPDYDGDEEHISQEWRSEHEVRWEEDERAEGLAEALDRARGQYLITAERMSKKQYAQQSFLIGPNLLPRNGKLLITAATGTGKSAIALYISACLATATPLFDLRHKSKKDGNYDKPFFDVPEKSYVCYLDYEIPEALRQKLRLEPLGKSFKDKNFRSNIAFPIHPSNYRLENQNGEGKGNGSFDRLLELATRTQPDVLVIDPFSSTHSLDENSAQLKQALNNIDRIIDASGTAVILIHHSSSKVQRDIHGLPIDKGALEKARGHSVIVDWPDAHVHFEEIKQKGQPNVKWLRMEFGKFRHGTKPKPKKIEADFANMTFKEANAEDSED